MLHTQGVYVRAGACVRACTFVFLWVCAASYLFSAGSWLLCTPLCSSDKTLFHSPSTMPYQSPNRNPDCNSLLNLNAHWRRDSAAFQSLTSWGPPKSSRLKFMCYCKSYYHTGFSTNYFNSTTEDININNGRKLDRGPSSEKVLPERYLSQKTFALRMDFTWNCKQMAASKEVLLFFVINSLL